jgi:hypothetical protein
MLLRKLLDHFDHYTKLHVEVNTVLEHLVDLGIQDEIRFHLVDIDESILRGLLFRYSKHDVPYGDPILCSEICIAKSLTYEWRRVVAVKELLHITDTEAETAESEKAVDKLVEHLAMPTDVREATRSSFNDRTHIIPALAVLVPKECRGILQNMLISQKITLAEAAKMARIPERYIELVLSDEFDILIEAILEASERENE